MCGIAGIIRFDNNKVDSEDLKRMTDSISHRGPDGEGYWISENNQVGLAHRRLSILDLSEAGAQPMHFAENRYSVTYNGEIYNYIEIRDHLKAKGYRFRTKTDTEVLLASYDNWGKDCLSKFDGMFAFAIWDREKQELFCARDRFGEKPFFYYCDKEKFVFASEIKAIWEAGIRKEISESMKFNFLYYGSQFNPNNLKQTFFKNIFSLEHSQCLIVDRNQEIKQFKYFDINPKDTDESLSEKKAISSFKELLTDSVIKRLRSDVAVGSSLSGGLDSSSIVAIIKNSNKDYNINQKVFSACFKGFERNEEYFIDLLSSLNGLDSYKIDLGKDDYSSIQEKVIHAQDEPINSLSIMAQYKVMELSKENNVKVLIDGQGADEILGGYHWYFNTYFKELFFNYGSRYKNEYNAYLKLQSSNVVNELRTSNSFGYLVKHYLPILESFNQKIREYKNYKNIIDKDYYEANKCHRFERVESFSTLNDELYNHTFKGPLQSLLKYSDRNSMANGVEVRLPFLSHELVEFAFRLPSTIKLNKGWTKWILREAFSDLLPEEIAWRKEKIGFESSKNSTIFNSKFSFIKKYYNFN